LQALKEADSDFSHIIPDFIVGLNSNPFNETREGTLEKRWLQACVKRYVFIFADLIHICKRLTACSFAC
jgi:hypothetical protein